MAAQVPHRQPGSIKIQNMQSPYHADMHVHARYSKVGEESIHLFTSIARMKLAPRNSPVKRPASSLDASPPCLETTECRSPQHGRCRPRRKTQSQTETRCCCSLRGRRQALVPRHELLCLDRQLFEMPIELRLRTQSHDQSAWIHSVCPTVRMARAEADEHLRTTQPDIWSFHVHWQSRSMNGDQLLDSKMASTLWLTLDLCTCTLSLSAEVCNCTV
jgi:hypothetical protein